MTIAPSLRCFECGATYPASTRTCTEDGAPLCPETVGQHWKIEGVLAPRLGGGVFAAFHAASGVRAAITFFPAASVRESATTDRMGRELAALRMLDKNRGILTLIEEGSEPDGSRFFAHELGTLRLLQDLLDEWQKPDRGLLEPPLAAQLVRPLLSALSTAHRIGVAHAGLTPLDIYLLPEGEPAEGITRVVEARLHGLLTFQMGPELRQAVSSDLRAIGATLFELLTGRRPPDSVEALRALPLPKVMLSPVGKVAMRALGGADQPAYLGAEEMLRALVTTIPTVLAPPSIEVESATRVDPDVTRRGQEPSKKIETVNTKPTVPIEILQAPARAASSQPLMPLPLGAGPVRSGLTAELHQVSIHDLMKERESMQKQQPVETLARSPQHRTSVTDIPMMPPPPDELPLPSATSGRVKPEPAPQAARADAVFQGISFGQEPTIPAVVNASLLAASAERSQYGAVPAELVPKAMAATHSDKAGSGSSSASSGSSSVSSGSSSVSSGGPSVSTGSSSASSGSSSVSISGSLPKPLAPTGSLVIPPQPSGPIAVSPSKPPSVSASGAAFEPVRLGGSPPRMVSRPPATPVPGAPLEYEPTPAAGQPPIDPDGATEPAPALVAAAAPASPTPAAAEPELKSPTAAPVPAGRELPPWVWAAILGVVCLLALLAGLFGR